MIRVWIGTALLAGSWLLGLQYFAPANLPAWFITVAVAVVLLGRLPQGLSLLGDLAGAAPAGDANTTQTNATGKTWPEFSPKNRDALSLRSWIEPAATIVLLLPALGLLGWPYRMAPLLLVLGLLLQRIPTAREWPKRLGCGAALAGIVLLAQGLGMAAYTALTAWSHELPGLVTDILVAIARWSGVEATADGSNIVMHSVGQTYRLGATWELLLDPATFAFFLGGMTLLAVATWAAPASKDRWRVCRNRMTAFAAVILAWLPLRAGLLIAIYVHRVFRSQSGQPLHAMNHFFSPWLLMLLLIAPALLAWRFLRWPLVEPAGDVPLSPQPRKQTVGKALPQRAARLSPPARLAVCVGCFAAAAAAFTIAWDWDPPGKRKEGRVKVIERHSAWEPTTKPYDTTSYGESAGYNYAAIYDYLAQYFEMSRLLEGDKFDDATLQQCDVLILKNPTTRYDQTEMRAIQRFVERGGGLMLIGDHTNLDGSSTIINDVVRPMGFGFRNDLLFSFGESPYEQHYVRPTAAHPAVQHVPWMDFAVSCSIDPGSSRGRPVLLSTNLWSMGSDYTHFENFHPVPQHCAEMRYGAFVQVWAARYGKGRALAFTDSTIFSNFCVFQPGKAELMLGMVEWLNHANPPCNPRPWFTILGTGLLCAGVWLARGGRRSWLLLLAGGMFGWAAACWGVSAAHAWAMPTPKCQRPKTRVVIDRTTSSVSLSKGAYTDGTGKGFGLFEQWIPRLGYYTIRKEGDEAFSGDVLVLICPNRPVSERFRLQLTEFVKRGGKLVVLDSPENTASTANSLLRSFELTIHHDGFAHGTLRGDGREKDVTIDQACRVTGGQTIAMLEQCPVAAIAPYGEGAVLAIGFGSLWNDLQMGEYWNTDPDATVRSRYELLYSLLGGFVEGRPFTILKPLDHAIPAPSENPVMETPARPKMPKPLEELPMQESGPAQL